MVGSGLAGVKSPWHSGTAGPPHPSTGTNRSSRSTARQSSSAGRSVCRLSASGAPWPLLCAISAGLICSGSRALAGSPSGFLVAPGQPCAHQKHATGGGRPEIFASGDCGLVETGVHPRVWAVRAAIPLARNLEAGQNQPLRPWTPQRKALQLMGGSKVATCCLGLWGSLMLGPHPLLWRWKHRIDRRFMQRFRPLP